MTPIIYLAGATHTPSPRHHLPVRRQIAASGPMRATVEARHPQVGWLHRGTIRRLPSVPQRDGALGRWEITDYDHTLLGEVTGDYLDAEHALLSETSALDAVVTAPDTPKGEA